MFAARGVRALFWRHGLDAASDIWWVLSTRPQKWCLKKQQIPEGENVLSNKEDSLVFLPFLRKWLLFQNFINRLRACACGSSGLDLFHVCLPLPQSPDRLSCNFSNSLLKLQWKTREHDQWKAHFEGWRSSRETQHCVRARSLYASCGAPSGSSEGLSAFLCAKLLFSWTHEGMAGR